MELQIYPEPVLREICEPVEDFGEQLHAELDRMREIMIEERGIGLAANQVGLTKRLFIADVSGVFTSEHIEKYGQPTPWDKKHMEFINPVIKKKEGEIIWNEGCLSLPSIYFDVKRAADITIEAQDRHGKSFSVDASNILSVCCQHEYDHLDGNVFIDYVGLAKRQSALRKLKKIKKQRQGS